MRFLTILVLAVVVLAVASHRGGRRPIHRPGLKPANEHDASESGSDSDSNSNEHGKHLLFPGFWRPPHHWGTRPSRPPHHGGTRPSLPPHPWFTRPSRPSRPPCTKRTRTTAAPVPPTEAIVTPRPEPETTGY